MSLWADKHLPNKLSKLSYHKEQAGMLTKLIESGDFPHLLVSGPSGCGKKTRVSCILRELYGAGAERVKMEHKSFKTPSNKTLEISTLASNYHIEINPSDVGIQDRVVVQEVIKGMAQTATLDPTTQRQFEVVVLRQVDGLSKDAQHGLRRTMEKYMGTCRLILITQNSSRVIAPLRSRCFFLRVPAPTDSEVTEVLNGICRKAVGSRFSDQVLEMIAKSSSGNLRRAILTLEACKAKGTLQNCKSMKSLPRPEWEIFLRDTATIIMKEQTPQQLLKVRERLYELLSHCIPTHIIFKGLVDELLLNCESEMRLKTVALASRYQHASVLGSKEIFHLEAFIAKFMAVYKAHLEEAISCMDFEDDM